MTAAPAAAAPAPKVKAADNAVLAPVDGAIKPITRTERYQSQMYVWISEVVDVKPGVPTIFTPPVRDLI